MIQNRLLSWYRKNKRLLPFRDRTEPYIIWLVEIMLQQTQVETVISYFNKWIQQFPKLVGWIGIFRSGHREKWIQ